MIPSLKINIAVLSLAIGLSVATNSQAQKMPDTKQEPVTATAPKADKAAVSYAYGAMMAKNLARTPLTEEEKQVDQFILGLKKGLEGDATALETAQANIQKRFGPGGKAEANVNVMYELGVSALGAIAAEIDIPVTVFDYKEIKTGFTDVLAGKPTRMPDADMEKALNEFFQPYGEEYKKKLEAKEMLAAQQAIEEGKAFLIKNGQRKEVVTLPSGLQYEVIKEGTGQNQPLPIK